MSKRGIRSKTKMYVEFFNFGGREEGKGYLHPMSSNKDAREPEEDIEVRNGEIYLTTRESPTKILSMNF